MTFNARTAYTCTASYALAATSRFGQGSRWTVIVDSDTAAEVVVLSEDNGTTELIRLTPGRTGSVSELRAHKLYVKALSGTPAVQLIDEGPATEVMR